MGVCPTQAERTEASGPWGSPACWGPPERSSALPSALSLPSGHLSQYSLKAKNPEVPPGTSVRVGMHSRCLGHQAGD